MAAILEGKIAKNVFFVAEVATILKKRGVTSRTSRRIVMFSSVGPNCGLRGWFLLVVSISGRFRGLRLRLCIGVPWMWKTHVFAGVKAA